MKISVISFLLMMVFANVSTAQSFTLVDRDTGEIYGPFDVTSERSIIISGQSYDLVLYDIEISDNMVAEDVLVSYLLASNWLDRLPYVFQTDGILERMRDYYTSADSQFQFMQPIRASAVSTGQMYNEEPDTLIYISTREFQQLPSMTVSFVMRQIDEKWFVDWDATSQLFADEKLNNDHIFAETLGLTDALFEVETLRLQERNNFTRLEARLKNRSGADISRVTISYTLYDGGDNYLAQGRLFQSNLNSEEMVVASGSVDTGRNVAASVVYRLESVDVYAPNGTINFGVERFFDFKSH